MKKNEKIILSDLCIFIIIYDNNSDSKFPEKMKTQESNKKG